jgi:hypothetical protein
VPTTVTPELLPLPPLLPELEPDDPDDPDVAEEPELESVPEGEEEVEEETKGLLSVDREAEVRSRSNWRILSGPCWARE